MQLHNQLPGQFYQRHDSAEPLQAGPERQKALASIGCAVGIFIITWHTLSSLLQTGALNEFAASLVSSPGSLLE